MGINGESLIHLFIFPIVLSNHNIITTLDISDLNRLYSELMLNLILTSDIRALRMKVHLPCLFYKKKKEENAACKT